MACCTACATASRTATSRVPRTASATAPLRPSLKASRIESKRSSWLERVLRWLAVPLSIVVVMGSSFEGWKFRLVLVILSRLIAGRGPRPAGLSWWTGSCWGLVSAESTGGQRVHPQALAGVDWFDVVIVQHLCLGWREGRQRAEVTQVPGQWEVGQVLEEAQADRRAGS